MLIKRLRSVVLVAGIAATTLLGPAGAASASPATSTASTCPSRALCLYEGPDFTGDVFTLTSFDPSGTCVSLVNHGWDDRAHSAINTHHRSAAMFQNDDCAGGPYQVPGNSSLPDLGSFTPESVWLPYWGS